MLGNTLISFSCLELHEKIDTTLHVVPMEEAAGVLEVPASAAPLPMAWPQAWVVQAWASSMKLHPSSCYPLNKKKHKNTN